MAQIQTRSVEVHTSTTAFHFETSKWL